MEREYVNSTRNWPSDLVEGQGLELLTPESPASQLLNWEQFRWMPLLAMSFQLLFVSILSFCPVVPLPSLSFQCTATSVSMTRGNNSSIIIKVSVSLNSFAFCLHLFWSQTFIPRVDLNLNIGQLCPWLISGTGKGVAFNLEESALWTSLNLTLISFSGSLVKIFCLMFKCFTNKGLGTTQ